MYDDSLEKQICYDGCAWHVKVYKHKLKSAKGVLCVKDVLYKYIDS